jgi:RimJ/RimL family protein N-acetyltransferase
MGGKAHRRPVVALRAAAPNDAPSLLAWRNDPITRKASRSARPVAVHEHAAWLAGVLADPDRDLLIAVVAERPVGQVRLDRAASRTYEISVTVAPEARGRGVGTAIIEAGVSRAFDRHDATKVVAAIRRGNTASEQAFRSAGFSPTIRTDGSFRWYVRARPRR